MVSDLRFVDWAWDKVSPYELLDPESEDVSITTGNVDFGAVFPATGFVYITDAVGHNYVRKGQSDKRAQMQTIWQGFNDWVLTTLAPAKQLWTDKKYLPDTAAKEYNALLSAALHQVHKGFEDAGKSSSMITALILNNRLQFTSIGDCTMLVVSIVDGKATSPRRLVWRCCKGTNQGDKNTELGSTIDKRLIDFLNLTADKDVFCLLLTDGVYEVLYDQHGRGEFERIDEPTENKDALIQRIVQTSLATQNPCQDIVKALRDNSLDSYRTYGSLGTKQIREADHDDCFAIAVRINKGTPTQKSLPVGDPNPIAEVVAPVEFEPEAQLGFGMQAMYGQEQADIYATAIEVLDAFIAGLPSGPQKDDWDYFSKDRQVQGVLSECSNILAQMPDNPLLAPCNKTVEILEALYQLPYNDDTAAILLLAKTMLRSVYESPTRLSGLDAVGVQMLNNSLAILEQKIRDAGQSVVMASAIE